MFYACSVLLVFLCIFRSPTPSYPSPIHGLNMNFSFDIAKKIVSLWFGNGLVHSVLELLFFFLTPPRRYNRCRRRGRRLAIGFFVRSNMKHHICAKAVYLIAKIFSIYNWYYTCFIDIYAVLLFNHEHAHTHAHNASKCVSEIGYSDSIFYFVHKIHNR